MAINKELTVEAKDEEIRISIGLKALAFAIENSPDWNSEFKIDTKYKYKYFANSIVDALNDEEEDGTTLIHRMLDEAALHALEQGYEGFLETSGD